MTNVPDAQTDRLGRNLWIDGLSKEDMPDNAIAVLIHDLRQAIDAYASAVTRADQLENDNKRLRGLLLNMRDDFNWAASLFDSRLAYLHAHGQDLTDGEQARAMTAQQHRKQADTALTEHVNKQALCQQCLGTGELYRFGVASQAVPVGCTHCGGTGVSVVEASDNRA